MVGFVEGVCLVATPALIRDFSPQVGRATAMGFWTSGPVIGSLIVSVVGSATIPAVVNDTRFWTHEYRICGIAGLVVFVIALVGLKELSPQLRDQLMVTLRDRALIEAKAKGLTEADIEAALRHPFRQLLKTDVIVSSIAVSIMLLIYYTAVAFSVIYLTTVFGLTVKDANGLGNWNWGFNVIAVILIGIISDRFRVRKPFMVIGGVLAAVMIVVYLDAGGPPSRLLHAWRSYWRCCRSAWASPTPRGWPASPRRWRPATRRSSPPAWPSGAGSSGSWSSSRTCASRW